MPTDAIDNALNAPSGDNDAAYNQAATNTETPTEYVPKTEFEQVTQRLSAAEKRMQDVARFMGGDIVQPDPEAIKQQRLTELVSDPVSYEASLVAQAEERAVARLQVEQIKSQFRAENPQLSPFIEDIEAQAYAIADKWNREGKVFSPQEALNEAAAGFQKKLQSWRDSATKEAKGDELKSQSLKFEVGSGQQNSQTVSDVLNAAERGDVKFESVRSQLAKSMGIKLAP